MEINALQHIKVVDLSRILAGPYCTMLLGDYGAEVIKIEHLDGDGTRQWGPPWFGELSAYFTTANRNKRSLTLNLKSEEGIDILRQLLKEADVLVENFKPGTMDRLGVGYEAVSAINPNIVYCSISGFGQDGPYRNRPGYDFAIQAQGGIMSITGPADGEPYKVGVAVVDVTTGLFAANAIQAALHARTHTGVGQYIDVALLDSQVAWLANVAQNYFATGQPPGRYGNAHPNLVPYELMPTSDGHVALAIGSSPQFHKLCVATGRLDLWNDPRYQTNEGRVNHRDELIPAIQQLFKTKTTDAWVELLLSLTIPCAPINDVATVLNDPHVRARNMVQKVEHPSEGPITLLGPVAKLSHTPAKIHQAPPLLAQDSEAILSERLGLDQAAIEALVAQGVTSIR